jgi:hypothetical protein
VEIVSRDKVPAARLLRLNTLNEKRGFLHLPAKDIFN